MFIGFTGQHQDIAYALRVDELHFFRVLHGIEFDALYFILAVETAIGAVAGAEIG